MTPRQDPDAPIWLLLDGRQPHVEPYRLLLVVSADGLIHGGCVNPHVGTPVLQRTTDVRAWRDGQLAEGCLDLGYVDRADMRVVRAAAHERNAMDALLRTLRQQIWAALGEYHHARIVGLLGAPLALQHVPLNLGLAALAAAGCIAGENAQSQAPVIRQRVGHVLAYAEGLRRRIRTADEAARLGAALRLGGLPEYTAFASHFEMQQAVGQAAGPHAAATVRRPAAGL